MTPPHSPPRRRRRFGVVLFALAALATVVVLVPGSPVHPDGWAAGPPKHNGRSAADWGRALADPDPITRRQAAFALGRLNTHAADSLPELVRLMRADPDADVRAAAAVAVSKMYPATKAVVPDLTAGLSDPEPMVRMHCVLALGRLKEDARPALAGLIRAATDEENDVRIPMYVVTIRQAALRTAAVIATGTPDAVPTLTAELARRPVPDETRRVAVEGLAQAGRHAAATAPAIRGLLTAPNDELRAAAEEALAQIGVSRDGETVRDEYDGLRLADAEQKRLWAFEHAGNVLNAYGFEPLAAALRDADAAALARLVAPDFAGSDLSDPRRLTVSGYADVLRLQDAGRPAKPLDRAGCVARLLDLRKRFAGTPNVKLVVATVRPADEAKPDGVWEGVAQLRLSGEHAPGAPAEVTASLRYTVVKPDEGGLATGGWLKGLHVRQVAEARSPRPLFVEVAAARGLNTDLHDNWTSSNSHVLTGGVFVTDYDRDGCLDVLVTDRTGNALYRGGAGGKFADVTAAAGLPRTPAGGVSACWADLDGDGWDDLIVAGRVFGNDGRGGFAEKTDECNLHLPADTSNILVADYDRDGKLDLYVARTSRPGHLSWLQGWGDDPTGNRLFRNRGGWRFEDATTISGTRGGHRSSFTAAWLDADDDGWPDLHVPNEFGDGVLLVNQKDGTFKPHSLADRPADFGTMGLAAGDLDNDGRIDLYCANMYSKAGTRVIGNLKPDAYPAKVVEKFRRFVAGSQLHLNKGGLAFDQVGVEKQIAAVGWAYGPALADLDGDGFLDVVATAGYISRDRTKPDG